MIKIKKRLKRKKLGESRAGRIRLIALGTLFSLMCGFRLAGAADCTITGYAIKANGFSGGSSKATSTSYTNQASVGLVSIVGDESVSPSGNEAKPGFWHIATGSFTGNNTPPTVTVNSPDGGEKWSGTKNILWTATDAEQVEAGALCATLYYGTSATGPWTQVATGLACTNNIQANYAWDTTSAANGIFWLKVKISDGVDDSGNDVSNASFIIDNTPPGNVANLQSTSHSNAIAQWNDPRSRDNTVDISWTAAVDTGGSGLDGYSILWDTSPATLPGAAKNLEETDTSTSSPTLSDGTSHYFHVRAKDNAGNWAGMAAHLGPFYIDTGHSDSPVPLQEAP